MDGYFRPKFKNEKKELHVLELDDCDFIPDEEVIPLRVVGRKHVCPRCGGVTHLQTEPPYCCYCNWDSLEAQTNIQRD
ncbi:MAG: hypothetical protein A4S09_14850 [Proteobacteria bacterium SG_bin7]|nr:MAG: hypothetical protein A4S09_14850 [Proteobacteria bacterium SG_bin7]